jgi:hypothetical protein
MGLLRNRPAQNTGIQRMAQPAQAAPVAKEQPLRFGGVVEQSNPGADILNRAKANAERIYAGYSEPAIQADQIMGRVGKPSNDQINLNEYTDRKNKEKVADATVENAGGKGWTTANITDPNDPSKTTTVRVRASTGEMEPFGVNGVKTNPEKPADIQKRIDAAKNQEANDEATRQKATEALKVLDGLSTYNPETKGETLLPDTETATGWTGNFNPITEKLPWIGPKVAGATSKISRLGSMLTLSVIQDLKERSKTGATGFGALNMKELGVLENAASALSKTNMDEGEYAQALSDIRTKLNAMLQKGNSDAAPVVDKTDQPGTPPQGRIRVKHKKTGQMGSQLKKTTIK